MNSLASRATKQPSLALVIISNGPGELSTWVQPIAQKIHERLNNFSLTKNIKISLRLALVPCPNAMGSEQKVAESWGIFEKITSAKSFWQLLINPHKYAFWPAQGIVIFLGGDQFWSVLLAARLGYKNITYAEWKARWPFWNDQIAAMSENVKKKIPKRFKKRCKVVGDLMADLSSTQIQDKELNNNQNCIALLPGSKKAKLNVGIPFFLEVADLLKQKLPETQFLLPVAPTTNAEDFKDYLTSKNPISKKYNASIRNIIASDSNQTKRQLITGKGTKIILEENYPAYKELSRCNIALTTVGANTAELGALGIPMIVIIPTQHLDIMEAWDGLIGLIARVPFLKRFLNIIISTWRIKRTKFFAWPNIIANRLVVPERVGNITPNEIAEEIVQWLNSPTKLKGQKEDLQSLRGKPGAIEALTNQIFSLIPKHYY